ncbi:MAG TPA: methyltransferase domain-containing protein [Pyrinomonadaceae bacterium]|nr:methyltransferase domain-containing protein [Pyrinomonadaceae bacterium]
MLTSSMLNQFRQRSEELEFIDTGDYTPAEYEGCIIELQRVNRWLGDTSALRHSLLAEIERQNLAEFSVLDVGAGSGELLKVIANWARRSRRHALLTGLELNPRSTAVMSERQTIFPEITAIRGDAFHLPFADDQFDYGLCSLFTHHFTDPEVVSILRELARVASREIFVIDLYRHPVAYFFYTTLGRLFLHNRLIRHDGALSILRSFTPDELQRLAFEAGLKDVTVTRRFPYRLVLSGKKRKAETVADDYAVIQSNRLTNTKVA